MFRHGPRTPADTYPNDPHINETFHPFGWGQLTNQGKAAMYETGQWMYRRYGGYLSQNYIPDVRFLFARANHTIYNKYTLFWCF